MAMNFVYLIPFSKMDQNFPSVSVLTIKEKSSQTARTSIHYGHFSIKQNMSGQLISMDINFSESLAANYYKKPTSSRSITAKLSRKLIPIEISFTEIRGTFCKYIELW